MIKNLTTYLLISFLSLCFGTRLKASHIVGGEIFYDHLGGSNYKITLKVYRDCFNGLAQLDNPALISIFDVNGNIVDTIRVALLSQTTITPSINNPCIQAPSGICVEEGIYEKNVVLPPKTGGYYVVYQRCCRNSSILNIPSPGTTGTTYWEHIPGPEVAVSNSSPRFNKFPSIYLCNGLQIKFDHSATDLDGDQLVYSLCDPYDGCSPPPSAGGCPVVPPPYSNIQFIPPFSGSMPMSSNPAININSSTGFLNGIPDIDGQWVVGVCVQEFRGSQLIGTHYRDFQFNVVTCNISMLAQFNDQSTPITISGNTLPNQFCNGLTVHFSNYSINGTSYTWNFGDPTTLADTSKLVNPNYTYPDTGAYVVSLIVNPGNACSDTSKKTFYVYPQLNPTFTPPPAQCLTGNSYNFSVTGMYAPTYTNFSWNFGASAIPIISTVAGPNGVTYSSSGMHPVSVTVQQKMCVKVLKDTVEVYQEPQADFVADSIMGCDPVVVTFTNNSTSGGTLSYQWQFSDGGSSVAASPTHSFTPAGVYDVTLTVMSNNGCIDTSQFIVPGMITVNVRPVADFSFLPTNATIFEPSIYFFDNSQNATSWYYTFGDGASSTMVNPSHEYGNWGKFEVVQTVVNGFGCPDTAIRYVTILPEYRLWIPNSFSPTKSEGLNDEFMPYVYGVTDYKFDIYDQWGEKIFHTADTGKGWDGTFRGKPCEQDIYVWMITFTNVVTKREEYHYGHVSILK